MCGYKVVDSSTDLVAPYINIDSEAANSINYEIKKLYNSLYDEFMSHDDGSSFHITGMSYKVFENKNIISIVIPHTFGVVPGGGDFYIETYNFNLDTGNEATKEDVAKAAGYTLDACNNKINEFAIKEHDSGDSPFEGMKNTFYLNQNSEFIAIYSGNAAGHYESGYNLNRSKVEEIKIDDSTDSTSNSNDGAKNSESNNNNKENNNSNSENTTVSTGNAKYDEAVNAIKKCFLDDNWVRNNVMMKKSVFGEAVTGPRQVSFMKVVNTNYPPMFVVEDVAQSSISSQAFIVSYQNGKVVVNAMPVLHTGHSGIGVDPNKAMLCVSYMHMGYGSDEMYDIKNGNAVSKLKINANPDVNSSTGEDYTYFRDNGKSISKAEYDKLSKEFQKYKFLNIGTELNKANIEAYVK